MLRRAVLGRTMLGRAMLRRTKRQRAPLRPTRLRNSIAMVIGFALSACVSLATNVASADDKPPSNTAPSPRVKHQVTGLFSREREPDLRAVFDKLPQFKLVAIDFPRAEMLVEYDVEKVFPGAKPEQVIERFDNALRGASNHTFGVKPLCTIDPAKLQRVEIRVVGLDCKACCLGAYEAIFRIKGVETATASFKEGLVTATIDPAQTDRGQLEMALKQRGVVLVEN